LARINAPATTGAVDTKPEYASEKGTMAVSAPRRQSAVIPSAIAIGAGLVAFLILIQRFESRRDALLVAFASAAVTAVLFAVWATWVRRHAISRHLTGPLLGQIPHDTNSSTFATPDSEIAGAYAAAARELEARTIGQVVLVTGAVPGQGASRTALNLAAAATRAGRRVVLVDGDPTRNGLSRFGRTGASPGLAELARGESDLADASRIWAIEEDRRLPFIPAGEGDLPIGVNGADPVADAVDRLTSWADLVLIDVPPLGWNSSGRPLAVHADGAVLVVTENSDPEAISRTSNTLDEAGAPVIGFVVNRANTHVLHHTPLWRRTLWRSLATLLISLLVFVGWNAYQIWESWQNVERDELDVPAAQALLPVPASGITTREVIPEQSATAVTSAPVPESAFQSFLVVGSDEGGARADVIILALFPADDSDPVMLSLPRDLYLPNRCGSTYSRINATLRGCGADVNGPTLLALTVEDFTGISIDHFALFDFDGFERIIDAVGGVEICVDRPVRDQKSSLDLPAGCTNARGAQALAWVRSRSTEEQVNGTWRAIQGINDLTRNERQQDVILAMFSKLKQFDSPSQLAAIVESLTNEFVLDDQLGVGDAISLAWSLRTLNPDRITRLAIPVRDFTTEAGSRVLLPTDSFASILGAARPELAAEAL
jgi:LCP family protein required for cell wall assembly